MRMPRSLMPRTIFRDVFRAFTRYYAAKDCLRGAGASIPMRNSLRVRALNSIACADLIRIFTMTHSFRSTLMNGFANVVLLMFFVSGGRAGHEKKVIESVHAAQDVALSVDPSSSFWRV